MTELVHHDQILATRERGQDANARKIPAAEYDRGGRVLPGREPRFECCVKRVVARDQPGRAGTCAAAASTK